MLTFSAKCLLIGLLCASLKAEFPNDPKPCNYGDSECIKKLFNYLVQEKKEGDSSINLLPIDPLIPEDIYITQGGDGPVQLNLTFSNSQILGLSKAVAKEVIGFGKDLATKHEVIFKMPRVTLVGNYAISGKILIFPVQGEGTCNVTMVDPEFRISFKGIPEEKDGNTFMKLTNFRLHPETKRVIYQFDNLFNGDKVLGDTVNKFVNENWKEVFDELRVPFDKSFGAVFKHIIDEVFNKYPYAKYFNE
ncbi:protein takeout-like [Glossina fuscipes fuscipes]